MDNKTLVHSCCTNIIERYHRFIEKNIIKEISIDDFIKKVFIPIAKGNTPPDFWHKNISYFKQFAIASEAVATTDDPDPGMDKSKLLFTMLLPGLEFVAKAYLEAESSTKPGWPYLLDAVEIIVRAEMLHPTEAQYIHAATTERSVFSNKGIHGRGENYAAEKKLVMQEIINHYNTEGPWKSRNFAAKKLAPKVQESIKNGGISEKLRDNQICTTIKNWIKEIPNEAQYFKTTPRRNTN